MKEVPPAEASKNASPFWIKVARGAGEHIRRLPYSDDELLVSLANSLELHEQAVRESRSLWGKFISVFAGYIDPDNIEIDGMRLQQLLALARSKPPAEIAVSRIYAVDLTTFRSLLKTATEHLNKRTPSARENVRD